MHIKPFEDLEFTDDFIFGKVMKNPEICKELIETLLHIKIEKIEYPKLQKKIKPYYSSKGVRLDVYVQNSTSVFDIEIQVEAERSLGKRMRYYQSMIDINAIMRGEDYSELKESFIIFICKYDPFKQSFPCYTFRSSCKEKRNLELDDSTTKIVYNANGFNAEEDSKLKDFLHFVSTNQAKSNFSSKLKELVAFIKDSELNRQEYMEMNLHDRDIIYKAKQEGREEGKTVGLAEGAQNAKLQTAKNFISMGLSAEQIAQGVNLPLETVLQLQSELQAVTAK